jgi:hypothetical protein
MPNELFCGRTVATASHCGDSQETAVGRWDKPDKPSGSRMIGVDHCAARGRWQRPPRGRLYTTASHLPLSPLRSTASITFMFATLSSIGVGTSVFSSTARENRSPWIVY